MIIASNIKYSNRAVTSLPIELVGPDGSIRLLQQPLYIVREVTRQDYLDSYIKLQGQPPILAIATPPGYDFFYEVSSD